MEKLFWLSSDNMPNIFQQDVTLEQTMERFEKGFTKEKYREYINDPTFRCIEIVSLEQFMEIAPDEFQMVDDTSF